MSEEQKRVRENAAKKIDIAAIDPNLKVSQAENLQDIVFQNVQKAPFQVYGLYQPQSMEPFCRMPDSVAQTVSPGVADLNRNTSGGRVRFMTNSRRIVIRAAMPSICRLSHMPLTGTSGFDLYETIGGQTIYIHTFVPPVDMESGYLSEVIFPEGNMRSFTLYFPLYNAVDCLEIGVEKGAHVESGTPYRWDTPVVYYGSSITQGGCASRPGNAYPAVISRRYDCDFINLGFSGNAKGEPAMAEYLSTLNMSVFVCDYDHNAPSVEHLENTLKPLVAAVRKAQPQLPIVLVSRPNIHTDNPADIRRREIVRSVYQQYLDAGDKRMRFIDGESLFQEMYRDFCTVDGCHPNDLGMIRMADVIGPVVGELLEK